MAGQKHALRYNNPVAARFMASVDNLVDAFRAIIFPAGNSAIICDDKIPRGKFRGLDSSKNLISVFQLKQISLVFELPDELISHPPYSCLAI